MTSMPKENNRMEDARRQGQFEGQVLATLGEIKNQVGAINTNQITVESRVRTVETAITTHGENFKESERVHGELRDQISTLTTHVDALVKYQTLQRGIIIALGVISTVISPIVTALILKTIEKATNS
jgi:hypothetical protein